MTKGKANSLENVEEVITVSVIRIIKDDPKQFVKYIHGFSLDHVVFSNSSRIKVGFSCINRSFWLDDDYNDYAAYIEFDAVSNHAISSREFHEIPIFDEDGFILAKWLMSHGSNVTSPVTLSLRNSLRILHVLRKYYQMFNL